MSQSGCILVIKHLNTAYNILSSETFLKLAVMQMLSFKICAYFHLIVLSYSLYSSWSEQK